MSRQSTTIHLIKSIDRGQRIKACLSKMSVVVDGSHEMPVADRSQTNARQAVLVALGGIGGLVAVLFLITRLGQLGGSGSEVPIQLGEPVFSLGNATELAEFIAESEPLLLPDVANGDRDIIVNHVGSSPTEGWHAFPARSLTSTRECILEWEQPEEKFIDSCTGDEYPADGTGLTQYGAAVDADGNLQVNLNRTRS